MPSMNSNGACGTNMPVDPRIAMRAPVPAIPLDRITLTPGMRAGSASQSVGRAKDDSAVESRTPTDTPVASSDVRDGPGPIGAATSHAPNDCCCACVTSATATHATTAATCRTAPRRPSGIDCECEGSTAIASPDQQRARQGQREELRRAEARLAHTIDLGIQAGVTRKRREISSGEDQRQVTRLVLEQPGLEQSQG